jgi:pimeloyl-ACP methyl ester carboxylesterase
MKFCICALTVVFAISAGRAQDPKIDVAGLKSPDEKTMELIGHRIVKLRDAIKALPEKTPNHVRVDVEIFLKAAEWALRHNEFYDNGKAAVTTLDRGLQRAQEAAEGKASWLEPHGKKAVRAYRSRVDGSIQPYSVSLPPDYGKDKDKKWRLDVVLHGRDATICETKFLAQHDGGNAPKGNDFVQIDIYGRGNNAYRWAGENDIFETIADFVSREKSLGRDLLDSKRIVLRGFSMGGAGTWHLGLHHPDQWCVIGPGAGFTTTHSYVKSLPNPLPSYQEPLLHIYDAVDYAENAFDVPIVAYSGGNDPQKAAADNIEKRLKEVRIDTMTHLIAPGLMHQFPAEWQAKAQTEYAKYAGPGKGKGSYPTEIRFVTYTLKYPSCDWIELLQLEKHYEQARVDASFEAGAYRLTTRNIARLKITPKPRDNDDKAPVVIDDQRLIKETPPRSGKETPPPTSPRSGEGSIKGRIFEKKDGKWMEVTPPRNGDGGRMVADNLRKTHNLQGPIDDAFTESFLCVKGTGSPYSELTGVSAQAQLRRFVKEWDKWMRGELLVKADKDVTEADIKNKNLILFGDPSSNALIAKVLPKLPLAWTAEQLTVNGQRYESSKYLPILIYPNALNPNKYVVINSGHTFHDAEFKGTNALLFPHLGDYAVVRPMPTAKDPAAFEVMKGGIFDDSWKYKE